MSFEEIYTGKLFGAIRGFDRLRFRGTIRALNTTVGMACVLNGLRILLRDFKLFFKTITDTIVLGAKRSINSPLPWTPKNSHIL